MGRAKRVCFPGMVYHVYNRGNNRQAIFLEPDDQRHFLSCLYHYKKKYEFQLFAFCLMTNHVHLLIRVGNRSVSKIMQSVAVGYSRWFNYKYKTSGHVWQGRFGSSVVGDDEYLLTAMQYIEQNPIRAGIVKDAGEYLYSSYRLNVRQSPSKLVDRMANLAFQALGPSDVERCSAYRERMMLRIEDDRLKNLRKCFCSGAGYMSEKFQQQLAAMLPVKRRPGRPRKVIIT